MSSDINAVGGNNAPKDVSAQIAALKADPNASAAFDQQLDNWLAQNSAVAGGGQPASVPGAGSPTGGAQIPSQAPVQVPAQALAQAPTQANAAGPAAPGPTQQGDGKIPKELQSLAPAIKEAAAKTGMSETEISAVIWDESRGKVGASTTNGGNGQSDTGLMQMNPGTFAELQSKHPELQGKSLSNASDNVLAGSFLLSDLQKQFGSEQLAERAYNSGPGSVDKSNANVTTTGLGDSNYIQKVGNIEKAIESGQALPP